MRNIIHLNSATTEGGRRSRTLIPCVRNRQRRGRRKKSTAPPLVTLGSRVGTLPRHFRKHRGLVEARPTSGHVRKIGPSGAVGQNGRKPTTVSSRSLEQAWLKQHHAEYAGAWVALEGARVVAQGISAREVLDTARSEGYDQPLVVHIPSEPDLPFGGW